MVSCVIFFFYDPFVQALCGCSINAPTLDGRTITLTSRDIIKPGMKKRIVGEGLPLSKSPDKRGDMILEFVVKFPDKLSQDACSALRQILPSWSDCQ